MIYFAIVDPIRYYSGSRPGFDRRFYDQDKLMSMTQEDRYIGYHDVILDHNENTVDRAEQGSLFYKRSRYADDSEMGEQFYAVENGPFETTVQVVGKVKNVLIVQDVLPDPKIHISSSPHYFMTTSDAMSILTNLDISDGRFTGTFKFRRRGKYDSLGLV